MQNYKQGKVGTIKIKIVHGANVGLRLSAKESGAIYFTAVAQLWVVAARNLREHECVSRHPRPTHIDRRCS